MCGIAGILSHESSACNLPVVIREMSHRLRHRGPDDEGFVLFGSQSITIAGSSDTQTNAWHAGYPYAPKFSIDECNESYTLALAHRRLSVIDLSEAGHQPMCSDDENVWITCNGEIYNYIELRSELEALGVIFKTRSDIEVLLKAYLQWGVRCLDRLNGMWAFVIYDRKKKLLFGARDRFGVKPLYYYHQDCFAFASEQKALLAVPGIQTGIIPEAVYEHLLLGKVELREEGFFKNLFELQPAHCFELDLETRRFSTRRYYQLSFYRDYRPFETGDFQAFLPTVKEKMQRAVELRLRSDVPVGFCLSGGLDSSSIVCLSHELLKEKGGQLQTFTAVNGHKATDESAWAQQVVQQVQAEPSLADCRAEDILPSLEQMIWHQDVPLYSTSTFAQNRVMKCARDHGTVILLDGQGGDELFGGYQTFYTSFLLELLGKSPMGGFPRELFSLRHSPTSGGIFMRSLMKLWFDRHLSPKQKNKFAARYRPELEYFKPNARVLYAEMLSLSGEFSNMPLNALLHHYFTGYYLKNLLRWEDRCSMQYSIESRTPFSDDIDLIEYIFSIPSSFKIHNGYSKALMRGAMKNILPEAIRMRTDKLGFATPQASWLMQIQSEMKERILGLKDVDDSGMIDYALLMKQWDTIFSDHRWWKVQDFCFRLLNYLMWRQKFNL